MSELSLGRQHVWRPFFFRSGLIKNVNGDGDGLKRFSFGRAKSFDALSSGSGARIIENGLIERSVAPFTSMERFNRRRRLLFPMVT